MKPKYSAMFKKILIVIKMIILIVIGLAITSIGVFIFIAAFLDTNPVGIEFPLGALFAMGGVLLIVNAISK